MPIEIGLWRIDGNEAKPVPASSMGKEKQLEEILERDLSILGLDILLIVGRQVSTAWGKFIDLLAIDAQGDLYVIELKRDRTPRDVVAQALDYGSWVKTLGTEEIAALHAAYASNGGLSFADAFAKRFDQALPDEINATQRLIIVASELDPSTERIVEYLSGFDVPVNVVFFRHLTDGDTEYLARSWLIDPADTAAKGPGKKATRPPWNGRDFYVSFLPEGYRSWDDATNYGFISGGGDPWYSRTLNALQPGHRVYVHLPGSGYVGVGEVIESSQPVSDFKVETPGGEVPILEVPLDAPNMGHDIDDPDKCEYVVRVGWLQTNPVEQAYWETGMFANQNTACRLRDVLTLQQLEQHFDLANPDAPGAEG